MGVKLSRKRYLWTRRPQVFPSPCGVMGVKQEMRNLTSIAAASFRPLAG